MAGVRSSSCASTPNDSGCGTDAIGMIGFSAGAFLAVDVALDPRAPQPRSSRRSTAGRPGARRFLRTHRRSSPLSPRTTSSSRSSKGFMPMVGRGPFVGAARVRPWRSRLRHGQARPAVGPVDRPVPHVGGRPGVSRESSRATHELNIDPSLCRGDCSRVVRALRWTRPPRLAVRRRSATTSTTRPPRLGGPIRRVVGPQASRRRFGADRAGLEEMRARGLDLAIVATGGDPGHAPARRTYEKAGFIGSPQVWYAKLLR